MSAAHWVESGSGPAMVLLHAFPCDHRMWEGQVPALVEAGWRVLVPDLPGFGDSPLPSTEPSVRAVVELLVDDLLSDGVDRLALAGLSVGGYLAMEWLRRYPEMLAGLALCDTKASPDDDAARQGRLGMAEQVIADPATSGALLRERLLPNIIGTSSRANRPEVVAQVGAWMDAAPADTIAWYQRAMAARPDSLVTLRECELPVFVVRGTEDGMSTAADQEAMLDACADSRLVEIPAAGHLSAVENPGPVTEALVAFAAGIRGAGLDG